MEIRRYFFEWERHDELREAVLKAGGVIVKSGPDREFYYIESNKVFLGHEGDVLMSTIMDVRFAEAIKSDLEHKLGMKLPRLN